MSLTLLGTIYPPTDEEWRAAQEKRTQEQNKIREAHQASRDFIYQHQQKHSSKISNPRKKSHARHRA